MGIRKLHATQAEVKLAPGCILLSSRPGTFLTRSITAFQGLRSGGVTNFNHAMRYAGKGMVHSQENTRQALPLEHWRGATLRAWTNLRYTAAQRERLVEESALRLGTWYDYPGIVGQMLRPIPWIGNWLAERLDFAMLNFCSESECEIERTVTPDFGGSGGCQISPADINAWCSAAGWDRLTFRLI